LSGLREAIDTALRQYEKSTPLTTRLLPVQLSEDADANPTVVLVLGIGMFSFGKNKTEARITGEFYTNAIHVMEGASALASAQPRRSAAGWSGRQD